MMKVFEINGSILLPESCKLTEEEILDKFIDFIENIDSEFIGMTELEDDENV